MIYEIITALSDYLSASQNIKTFMYDTVNFDADGSSVALPLCCFSFTSTDVPEEIIPGLTSVTQLAIDLFYKANSPERSLSALNERSNITKDLSSMLMSMDLRNFITARVDGFCGFENISITNKYDREILGSENVVYNALILLNCRYKNLG